MSKAKVMTNAAGPASEIERLLKGVSSELDQLGSQLDQLQDALSLYFEALSPELRAAGCHQFQSLDSIAQHTRALAGLLGILQPQLHPDAGVQAALASVSLSALAGRLSDTLPHGVPRARAEESSCEWF